MKLGLIGSNIAYSYSERVHKEFGYDYSICEVEPKDLASFVKTNDYDAFNVTIPHKKEIIKFLDKITTEAARLNAVNTVTREKGQLVGHNTDYFGMNYMLKHIGISLANKKVMILGGGGTSSTAQALAADRGAKEVVIVGRNTKVNYSNYLDYSDCDILINTTPIGTYPNNSSKLVDLARFCNIEGVVEVVYNPLKTALTVEAHKQGVKYSNGLMMLVAQAKKAKDLFFAEESQDSIIDKVYSTLRRKISNIVLVGMPSSGKTTIGKLLSKSFGKKFVDTDYLIESQVGISSKDIIIHKGEQEFRQHEKQVISEVAKKNGQVIATGGGTVLDSENVDLLMQNGIIIYIYRDFDKLTSKDRPLSTNLKKMYELRDPIYSSCSDITVQNNGLIKDCVNELEVKINEYFDN